MCPLCRLVVLGFWLLVRAASMLAQGPPDPTGHWEGSIQLPNEPMVFAVDVTRSATGELAATFAQASAGITGFPFSKVEFEGRTLRLVLKASAQPSTLVGTLAEDGKSISGDVEQAGEKTTFTLTRAGQAKLVAAPTSGRISKALEGKWNGAVDFDGKQMRLILTMSNRPDGTATGTIMSPDGSGIEIPVGIKEAGDAIAIDVPSVGASFSGTIEATKSELVGTWRQSTAVLPLTFRRSPS
jgi:hypothetical protein